MTVFFGSAFFILIANENNPDRDAKKMAAHSRGPITDKHTCLENYLSSITTIQKLSSFVFDAAVLESRPWSEVRQNNQVLKRFDLTPDDVINNNYTFDLQ